MDYTIKQRVGVFLGFSFFLILLSGMSFIACKELLLCLTYPASVTFSPGMLFATCAGFPVLLMMSMLLPVAFCGRQITMKNGKKLLAVSLFLLLLIIVVTSVFSVHYTDTLVERKYIRCKGIPGGWMPGMATKYAINESLCHKK